MAGLAALMKKKPPPPEPGDRPIKSYAMAVEFPSAPDRVFDGELNLLLIDGLLHVKQNIFL